MCTPACNTKPTAPVTVATRPPPVLDFLRVRWLGVPLFIRIYTHRHRSGRKPSTMPGCGCSVRLKGWWMRILKRLPDRWQKSADAALARAAIGAAKLLARILRLYLAAFEPSPRLASLMAGCGAVTRHRIVIRGRPHLRHRAGRSVIQAVVARTKADGIDFGTALQRTLQEWADEGAAKEAAISRIG